MPAKKRASDVVLKQLRAIGLGYPGAGLNRPWPGHCDLVVGKKTFAFLSVEGDPFSISVKLPRTGPQALLLPHAQPTGYGLGKSGWVSVQFPEEAPPLYLLTEWIEESYRSQAPKTLVKQLDAQRSGAPAPAAKKNVVAKTKTRRRK